MNSVENFLGSGENYIPGVFFIRKKQSYGEISYSYVSKSAGDILGLEGEIKFTDILNMIHFADKDNFLKRMTASEKDLKKYTTDFRFITKDGRIRWLTSAVDVKKEDDGSVVWNGIIIDVTDSKQHEEWLATTLNNAPEGIVTFASDCVIISANATMSKLFGYDEDELIGKRITDLMNPEQAPYFMEYIDNYLLIVDNCGIQKLKNYECIRKDGSVFPVEFSMNDIKNMGNLLFVLAVRDITERKQMEKALRENEIKLENIVSAMPCAFFTAIIKSDGTQEGVYLSDGADKLFGGNRAADRNRNGKNNTDFLAAVDDDDANRIREFRRGLFKNRIHDFWEDEVRLKDGRWVQYSVKPEYLDNGKILNHGLIIDITKRKHAEEKIRFMAYHDMMTQIGNRSFLMKEFPKVVAAAKRGGNKFAVISIVPVNISEFYANSGYDVGDALMAEVASKLMKMAGIDDVLAYVSGSRFVLLKGNITDSAAIDNLCAEICDVFDEALTVDNQEFEVSVKIGVSVYPDHSTDIDTLLRYSEAALMYTKHDFNDEYKLFTEEMKADLSNKLLTRNRLKYAIQNRQIVPYFQAQVDVATGKICGMEVLARWIDEKEGVIPPYRFIPIAEEFGLIEPMTELVIEEACRINKKWIDAGIARVPIAVNISGKHYPDNMLKLIKRMIDEVRLPSECLEVELTESSMMDNPDKTRKTILQLLEMGVTCSIDDFGTGYSSLSMLKSFPIKKIKIDRSFVLDIDKDDGYAIVNATIAMGKALNLTILAEGVDNKRHFNILRKQGCEIIQGYLFSKPVSAQEMEEKLAGWNAEREIAAVME